jgi:hypothetical protein
MTTTSKDTVPPGASMVREVGKRGTGWYCQACAMFIAPLWIRRGRWVFPACRECFHDELAISKSAVIEAKEDADAEVIESVVMAPEAARSAANA